MICQGPSWPSWAHVVDGRLVGASAGHGFARVGEREQSCAFGELIGGEAVRVPASLIARVLRVDRLEQSVRAPEGDRDRILSQRGAAPAGDRDDLLRARGDLAPRAGAGVVKLTAAFSVPKQSASSVK